MKGAVRGLRVHAKALEIIISLASANDATGYYDALGAYDNHVLPLKELFRNDGGEAAEQVPATVNHNNLRGGRGRAVINIIL